MIGQLDGRLDGPSVHAPLVGDNTYFEPGHVLHYYLHVLCPISLRAACRLRYTQTVSLPAGARPPER